MSEDTLGGVMADSENCRAGQPGSDSELLPWQQMAHHHSTQVVVIKFK
jgi:hypothetical protein